MFVVLLVRHHPENSIHRIKERSLTVLSACKLICWTVLQNVATSNTYDNNLSNFRTLDY